MTTDADLDILGIGNAIVDVILRVSDEVVADHGLHKGSMTLIDSERAEFLYSGIGPGQECSGGSVANAVAIAASLGSRVGFVGKVCNDPMGEFFSRDLRSAGVHFDTAPSQAGAATARSLIMVTPDGQRTMNTYLGACMELGLADVEPELVGRTSVTYLEGYLWDSPPAVEACQSAIAAARRGVRKIALTLADTFCVDRHRQEFRELVDHDVDILFANEAELMTLYETDSLAAALSHAAERCEIVAVTQGDKGSVVLSEGALYEVPAEPVDEVVDSTGAGDAYAAGLLHGLASGRSVPESAALGSAVAAEIISLVGARLEDRVSGDQGRVR